MAYRVDPDETPRSAASHLGLHCLLRPVCPNTYSKMVIVTVEVLGGASVVLYVCLFIFFLLSVPFFR